MSITKTGAINMAITGNIERNTRELTPEQMNDMLTNDLDTELSPQPIPTPLRSASQRISEPERKKNYQIMLTPTLHDRGAEAAKDLGDSFSGLMESLLDEYLRSRY